MRIGIASRNIVFVQCFGSVQQPRIGPEQFGQGLQQSRNRVSPSHTTHLLDNRLDSFFRALLGGKAGPLVVASVERAATVGQISLALF